MECENVRKKMQHTKLKQNKNIFLNFKKKGKKKVISNKLQKKIFIENNYT